MMSTNLRRVLLSLTLILTVFAAGGTQAQLIIPPPSPPMPDFALSSGHPLAQVVIPRLIPVLIRDVSPRLGDVTLVPRVTAPLLTAVVDALAPYHPTAVGIYTRIERRPQEEWTLENLNIATLYASYHSLRGMVPQRELVWLSMLTDYGLDPAAGMDDTSTPAGIGTAAGIGAVEARLNDGMNQLGLYANTTDYAPVNTAYKLADAGRWQPALVRNRLGSYVAQSFVTPQMANVEPYSDIDPREYRMPAPIASDPANAEAYKAQVDLMLEASANLTDEQKMLAELFDNKIAALGFSFIHRAIAQQISPMDFARGDWITMGALLDAMTVVWQEKARYDAVRPFSAIAHVYGDQMVTAWGGPGRGTTEIPASQWQSYIPVADHPEYPSASTCSCAAHGQASRHFFGTDELGWTVTFRAGSSLIEPGVTPAEDLTVTFDTWTDLEVACGQSRIWAGVHFPAAVAASQEMCHVFGDTMYAYYESLMDGTAPARGAAVALAPDPRRHDRAE